MQAVRPRSSIVDSLLMFRLSIPFRPCIPSCLFLYHSELLISICTHMPSLLTALAWELMQSPPSICLPVCFHSQLLNRVNLTLTFCMYTCITIALLGLKLRGQRSKCGRCSGITRVFGAWGISNEVCPSKSRHVLDYWSVANISIFS